MDRIEELRQKFLAEPLAQFLGLTLDDLRPGHATIGMTPRPETLTASGIVQGGIIAALADYAGVYAAMASVPAGFTPAVNINVNCFRPVMGGETVVADARVANDSRITILTIVEIRSSDGKCKSLSTIQFAKPKP